MRTGVSYLGHHNPGHMASDCREIQSLRCDDVLLAAQENDFLWMTGKVDFFPKVAKDHGLRPIGIFWGSLNLFGGGRSSQFLLEHPDCHQVRRDGSYNSEGCYVNRKSVARIKEMIDKIASVGFEGYFIDEPTHLQCFCSECRRQYSEWYGGELLATTEEEAFGFRTRCVVGYIASIAGYVKTLYPHMETMTCLMECDKVMWKAAADIAQLDNLGSDIYWVNSKRDIEEMKPLVRELDSLCKNKRKTHHEWLQCWNVRKGNEARITGQGEILIREQPDSLYVWAYQAQLGTAEACDDAVTSWKCAVDILKAAKGIG